MTNLEKIKKYNAEEMADFFEKMWDEGKCFLCCPYDFNSSECQNDLRCETGVVKWLNSEVGKDDI